MSFKDRLKEARTSKGFTQEQLADKIGVAKSTLTGYEKGNREPDMAKLAKIMDSLEINADYLFQDDLDNMIELVISLQERDHIKKYRALEIHGKDIVDTILDKEYEFMQQRRTKAIEQKKPTEFVMLEPPKVIPSYQSIASASAGTGQYVFDDLVPNLIEVDTDSKADFVIDVSGDSMQPTYYDGDGLLVKQQPSVNIGEIGIYMVDNEAYVKECGGDRLISHNKEYADILLKEHQDIRCIGKVLGKLK